MLRVLSLNTERGWRGGENQVFLLARGLAGQPKLGISHAVACRAGEPLAARLRTAGLGSVGLAGGGMGEVPGLLRLIRRHRIDLIHAHASQAHGLGLALARFSGRPLVVTRRVDFPVGRGPAGRVKYGNRVARFVAISAGVARVLIAGGVPPGRIRIIPSGIDPARVGGATPLDPTGLGLPVGCRIWLAVGALVDHKGHRHLLDAWAEVEAAAPDAALVIAGEGPLRGQLQEQARRLGLRRCVLAGQRNDVPALLATAVGFVMPSLEEGLGTAILDAFCAGLPVVASRAGGIPELVADGVTGLLVPPGAAAPLATAILRLHHDPARAAGLAVQAQRRSEYFHYRRMVAAYAQLYHEVVGG